MLAGASRSVRMRLDPLFSYFSRYRSRRLRIPGFLVSRLVRSKTAIRFLARHRLWPRSSDARRMTDDDVRTFIRTIGLEADVRAALAHEDGAASGDTSRSNAGVRRAEGEP